MLGWLFASFSALAAPPLEVHFDPDVLAVTLVCGSERLTSPVTNGVATFGSAPANCSVQIERPIGKLSGPGVYTCSSSQGCKLEDIHHAPIADAAGRVNIILTGTYDTAFLELGCPNGYRTRGDIADNTATFNGVPKGDCDLQFKGGAPARFRPISPGSDRCSLTGPTAVCTAFKP